MGVNSKTVLMAGTSLVSPGGMTSVVRTLKAAGLFDAYRVDYLSTYESGAIGTQLRVMSAAVAHLLRRALSGSIAVLHAHSASRGSFWRKSVLCALARLFRIPYLFHIHSGEFPTFFRNECGVMARWWVRHTLTAADAVICLSSSWADQMRAIAPGARTMVIGNPVAVPALLPPMRTAMRNVLFLGRLREKKGVFDLLKAIPEILKHCPELRFTLAGDEGLDEVRRFAASLGVAQAISLPGWVEGAAKDALLAEADIFVLPSYFEGLPVGILEAMATGAPIVATNVGGIPDLVEDQRHALLVPAGDPAALAAAIVRMSQDAMLRQHLRTSAFHRVEELYALPRIVEQLGALYGNYLRSDAGLATNGEVL